MNYILFIIPILFFIGIYVKKLHVKENMADYKLEEDRSFNKIPINNTCGLYGTKPGSSIKPPAVLDHDKEVWINSKLLKKKIKAIRKATDDKMTWEYNKMNTYNKKTTPFDSSIDSYEENLNLNEVKTVEINPITTTFDFDQLSPTGKNPYLNVHGLVEKKTDFMYAPKPNYIFSKEYGFRNYK